MNLSNTQSHTFELITINLEDPVQMYVTVTMCKPFDFPVSGFEG